LAVVPDVAWTDICDGIDSLISIAVNSIHVIAQVSLDNGGLACAIACCIILVEGTEIFDDILGGINKKTDEVTSRSKGGGNLFSYKSTDGGVTVLSAYFEVRELTIGIGCVIDTGDGVARCDAQSLVVWFNVVFSDTANSTFECIRGGRTDPFKDSTSKAFGCVSGLAILMEESHFTELVVGSPASIYLRVACIELVVIPVIDVVPVTFQVLLFLAFSFGKSATITITSFIWIILVLVFTISNGVLFFSFLIFLSVHLVKIKLRQLSLSQEKIWRGIIDNSVR